MTDVENSAVAKLPAILKADIDFRYVQELREPLRRVAAYYEYARESPELNEITVALRKAGAFEVDAKELNIPPQLMQKLNSQKDTFDDAHLLILYDCKGFPEKPFRDVWQDLEVLKHYGSWFGIDYPSVIPWKVILELLRQRKEQGVSAAEFFENWTRSKTLNAISIPWNYRNDELTEFFRELIPRLRPPEFPEPKKAGRKGRSSGLGAIDMLNQLAAVRLHRAGFNFDQASRFTPYSSRKGWDKAVRAAEERINNMTTRPFFSSSSRAKRESK